MLTTNYNFNYYTSIINQPRSIVDSVQIINYLFSPQKHLISDTNYSMALLTFTVINKTSSVMKNIKCDASFQGVWIGKWLPVAVNGLEQMKKKQGLQPINQKDLENYKRYIQREEGSHDEIDNNTLLNVRFTGAYTHKDDKQNELVIWLKWENENGFNFEKFIYYKIEKTSAYDVFTYTLIPEIEK